MVDQMIFSNPTCVNLPIVEKGGKSWLDFGDLDLILDVTPGPEVIKLFPCSTQLNKKIMLLINVKTPALIVGILTFIGMINWSSDILKARNFFTCGYFSFYEQ